MCENAVGRHKGELLGRYEYSALSKCKKLTDSLCYGGFSATVSACQDINGILLVKRKVIRNDILVIVHIHC